MLQEWNLTVLKLLSLAAYTQHISLEIHSSDYVYQYFSFQRLWWWEGLGQEEKGMTEDEMDGVTDSMDMNLSEHPPGSW